MKKEEKKPVQFHATKQLLIDTVLFMLETQNPGTLTADQVLAKARISTGSLYHHFDDFADLLEQALCIDYEKFTERTIDLLLMANEQATTFKSWGEGVQGARRISHGPLFKRNRTLRVWAVAHASLNERMNLRLGAAQDRLNNRFIQFLDRAKELGYVRPDLNSHAIAVFIQSYHFGSVIDDVANTALEQDEWIKLLDLVTQRTFINVEGTKSSKQAKPKKTATR